MSFGKIGIVIWKMICYTKNTLAAAESDFQGVADPGSPFYFGIFRILQR